MYTEAIILAAGMGSRMGAGKNKQFIEINNKPIIYYTLKTFFMNTGIMRIVLVIKESEYNEMMEKVIKPFFYEQYIEKKLIFAYGGKERYNSVYNGLKKLKSETTHVMIHDGARPLVSDFEINKSLEMLLKCDAVIVGVQAKSTMKVTEDGIVKETLPREQLIEVQTPQSFSKDIICQAYEKGMKNPDGITDDAMMVERYTSVKVHYFLGRYANIKVTTEEDLETMKTFLKKDEKSC